MDITVILCTFNRCESLAMALASAAALVLPDSVAWEIVVVDNNSSDRTREMVENFCQRFPDRVRYLFEPQQGLCHARNAGIREAQGDVIVFMDDDVTVEPGWLQKLTAALNDPKWAGAGGRILPLWSATPPSWLPSKDRWALAPLVVFDLGDKPGALSEAPFGANMAFRKEMFRKYGAFRTDLDRVGSNLVSGGDTEFGCRLLAAGEQLRYEPSALVYHPVTPDRMLKDYFLRWHFDGGRGTIRQFGIDPNTRYCVWGIPLYLFRRLGVWTLRWMLTVGASPRFECKLKVWTLYGQMVECHRRSLSPNRQESLGSA
jgi:glycosyltransferase involved in cell wall biosynthesis